MGVKRLSALVLSRFSQRKIKRFLKARKYVFFSHGFTYVELVSVIAVVGILATVLISTLNPTAQIGKGQDSRRENDTVQLRNALEEYYSDHKKYPDTLGQLVPDYIRSIPKDPKTGQQYQYQKAANNSWGVLLVKLDQPDSTSFKCPTPVIQGCPGMPTLPPGEYGCAIVGDYVCGTPTPLAALPIVPTSTPTPTPTAVPPPPNPLWGDGHDGAITVSDITNINSDAIAPARTYPDGIAYAIIAPTTGATTITRSNTGDDFTKGIAVNDEVMVINLGSSSLSADEGNYEFRKVTALTASQITLSSALSKSYNSGGAVRVQRIPNYTNVTVNTQGLLTAGRAFTVNPFAGLVDYWRMDDATPSGTLVTNAVTGGTNGTSSSTTNIWDSYAPAPYSDNAKPKMGLSRSFNGTQNVRVNTTTPNISTNAITVSAWVYVDHAPLRGIYITNKGSGYTSAPTVTISGGGAGATATPTISGGEITAITLTNAGFGYTPGTTVTISGGGGSGATAVTWLGGGSSPSIILTNGGSGYTSAPTVTISGGGGSGATATATINAGTVSAITLTNPGSGYTSATTVTISGGGGSGATAISTIGTACAHVGSSHNTILAKESVFLLAFNNNCEVANYIHTGGSWSGADGNGAKLRIGEWSHIAMTFDGTTLKSYYNGVLIAGSGTPRTGNIDTSAFNLYFGARPDCCTQTLLGAIDEVGIWNRAASPAEIGALWNMGTGLYFNGKIPGLASSGGGFPSTNVAAYWRLDETAVGTGQTIASQVNSPATNGSTVGTQPSAKVGNARVFNGTSEYIRSNLTFQPGSSDFTITTWVNTTESATNRMLIGDWDGSGATHAIALTISDSNFYDLSQPGATIVSSPARIGKLFFHIGNTGAGNGAVAISTSNVNDGQWHHIAALRRGTNLELYVDGALQATTAIGSFNININPAAKVSVGATANALWYTKATVDEVGIWNTALTPSQINTLSSTPQTYSSSLPGYSNVVAYWPMDDAKGATTITEAKGTYPGTPTGTQPGAVIGKARSFNGTSEYISVLSAPNLGGSQASVSFWFYPTNSTDPSQTMFISRPSTGGQNGMQVDWKTSGDTLSCWVGNGSWARMFVPSASVTLDQWHHLTCTYDGTDIHLYIDGTYKGSNVKSGSIPSGSYTAYLGNADNSFPTQGFYGQIDEVGIWNKVLSASEVSALWSNGNGLTYAITQPIVGPQNTGAVAFRANGTLTVATGAGITADALGHVGAPATTYAVNANPQTASPGTGPGKGTDGRYEFVASDPGAYYSPMEGGGGGYGSAGKAGSSYGHVYSTQLYPGSGGLGYGQIDLRKAFLGSGGGGATSSYYSAPGGGGAGAGGGILTVYARNATINGQISAHGQDGRYAAWVSGGGFGGRGGGGSGGSVLVTSENLANNGAIGASGGWNLGFGISCESIRDGRCNDDKQLKPAELYAPTIPGYPYYVGHGALGYENGVGNGGDGRVRIEYLTSYSGSGTTTPTASRINISSPDYPYSGLAAYWNMEDNASTIADLQGLNDGIANNTLTIPGAIGNSKSFNGSSSSYISIPTDPSLEAGTDFTVSAWFINTDTDSTAERYIVAKFNNNPSAWLLGKRVQTNGDFGFTVRTSGASGSVTISGQQYNDTKWHHAVGVKQGATLRLYVDGTQVATTGIVGLTTTNGNSAVYIGNHNNSTPSWIGAVDEVGIWNRALTTTEISALYNNFATTNIAFSAGVAQTQPLQFPYGNLVGYYTHSEGARPSSPSLQFPIISEVNTNTLTGASNGTLAVMNRNSGLLFNGINTFMDTTLKFRPAASDFTFYTSFRTTDNRTGTRLIYQYWNGNPTSGDSFALLLYDDNIGCGPNPGKAIFIFRDGTALRCLVSTTTVNDGRWHTVWVTRSSTTLNLYVDDPATVQSTANVSGFNVDPNPPSIQIASMGQSGSANKWNGAISTFRAWDRALDNTNTCSASGGFCSEMKGASATTNLQGWWDFPNLTDKLGRTAIVTGNNVTPPKPSAILGSALAFNGSTDYYAVPDNALLKPTTELTISMWCYTEWFGRNNCHVSKEDSVTGSGYVMWFDSTNKFVFQAGNGTPWATTPYNVLGPVLTSGSQIDWYHVVGVHSATEHSLYINGVKVATAAGGTLAQNTLPLWVGRDGNPTGTKPYSYGIIDDLAIWNRALGENEIKRLYNNGAGLSY